MKERLIKMRAGDMLAAIIWLIVGAVMIVWPGLSIDYVCLAVGVVMIASGALSLLSGIFLHRRDVQGNLKIVAGVVAIPVGIWLIRRPEVILSIVPIIVGAFIVLHGLRNFSEALQLGKVRFSYWWVVILIAIITVCLGAVMILNPFETVTLMVRVMGLFLVMDAGSDMWILLSMSKLNHAFDEQINSFKSVDLNTLNRDK